MMEMLGTGGASHGKGVRVNNIDRAFKRAMLGLMASAIAVQPAFAEPEVTPSSRVKRNVVVRSEADGDTVIGALNPGDEAALLGQTSRWYQIRLPDGRIGYVSKSWTVITEDGQPFAATSAAPIKVHVIDVGTGLATFIEGPGFTLLYDAGSQDDLATGQDNRVVAYIKAVRPDVTTIDHLILSHPHKDHLELLPDVFEKFSVRHVWDSGAVNKTRGYCRFLKAVAAEPGAEYHNSIATGGSVRVVFPGRSCREATVQQAAMMTAQPVALGPSSSMSFLYRDPSHHSDPNENTVVVRLDHGTNRLLLAGDAEGGERQHPSNAPKPDSIEAKLIACCAAALRANVLIVGHHGSLTSSRRSFLDAVGASIYVISSGPYPYKKVVLPDEAIETELKGRGQLFQTDLADDDCALDETKIGPDADESPGGCDSVVVTLPTSGPATAVYNRSAD